MVVVLMVLVGGAGLVVVLGVGAGLVVLLVVLVEFVQVAPQAMYWPMV